MRMSNLCSLAMVVCTISATAACSNTGDDRGPSGSGGGGGASEGGEDGSSTGGKGGSNTGGKGGSSNGGQAGTATSGGTGGGGQGGTVGTGGATTGGSGGTAAGGTGGTKAGGTGGTKTGGTGGSATIPAEMGTFLFSGKTSSIDKLVSTDPAGGYFYSGGDASTTGGAEMLNATQSMGLPAGMTHALSAKSLQAGLTILGVNFRADDGQKWRFFDASSYAGITFWARATRSMVVNTTLVDAENTTPGDKGGTCPAPTPAPDGACKPVAGVGIVLSTAWKPFKLAWADFVDGGPATPASLARIDWLTFQMGSGIDFWITGIRLATAADLE